MDASDNSSDFNDLEVAAVMAFRKSLIQALNDDAHLYSAIIHMRKHLNMSIRNYLFYIMFCESIRSLEVPRDYEQFGLNICIRFSSFINIRLNFVAPFGEETDSTHCCSVPIIPAAIKISPKRVSDKDGFQHFGLTSMNINQLLFYDFHLVKIEYKMFYPIDLIKFTQLLMSFMLKL